MKASEASQKNTLSDHPVLEFLNTTPMIDGALQDLLQTDADVLTTLTRLGWHTKFTGTGLLATAKKLRDDLRSLIETRKAGNPLHLKQLNRFLTQAKSHLELSRSKDGTLATQRVWEHETPAQALAPLAESAADLLANGDFHLIRRCESDTCVLWFYDRTKSHRRRWCSMTSCGNRHKVAAFRKRQAKA
jgi:predicted RNA-binding Zn ribbon-like protein